MAIAEFIGVDCAGSGLPIINRWMKMGRGFQITARKAAGSLDGARTSFSADRSDTDVPASSGLLVQR